MMFKSYARATILKDKRVNIRISERDLNELKRIEDTIMETTGEQDEAFAKVKEHLESIKKIMDELEIV